MPSGYSEKRKKEKGYIWKGAKGIDSTKGNYAERVLTSHKRKLKKKKKRKQKGKGSTSALAPSATSATPSESAVSLPPSTHDLCCSSKALQAAFIKSPHGAQIHEAFAEHKDQEQVDTSNKISIKRARSIKKACYHCLCLVNTNEVYNGHNPSSLSNAVHSAEGDRITFNLMIFNHSGLGGT